MLDARRRMTSTAFLCRVPAAARRKRERRGRPPREGRADAALAPGARALPTRRNRSIWRKRDGRSNRYIEPVARLIIALSVLLAIAGPCRAGPDAKQFFEKQSRQSGGGM